MGITTHREENKKTKQNVKKSSAYTGVDIEKTKEYNFNDKSLASAGKNVA